MADKDDQSDPLVGQTLLEKLKVIRKLGGGGMGAVYEVEHLITRHRRALKLIRPEYVKRRSYMRRLIREAGVAGQLQTPYVVETFDAGTMEDGSAYVLMELLDGEQLIDLLERENVLPIERLVGIMTQLCEGVGVAHRAGIVHRDLKPENIFLVRSPSGAERVKILDFGISKFEDKQDQATRLTTEGTILGTPFYMSPEQAAAREVDERTDVYSVGVMMYEALAGRLPFDAQSVGALFIKIAAGEYLPLKHYRPDVPDAFVSIVERAMHRDREQRFQTMEELRTALLPFARGESRIRAKTISDAPTPLERSTVAYEEVPVAPALPQEMRRGTLSMGAPKPERRSALSDETLAMPDSEPPGSERREEEGERAFASAAPSRAVETVKTTRPEPASRGAWIAAAAILGVAAAIGIGFVVLGDDPDAARTPEPVAERPTPPAEPTERPAPPVETDSTEPTEADRVEGPEVAADEPMEREGVASERVPSATARSGEERTRPRRRERTERRGTAEPDERRGTAAERAGLELNPYGD